MVNLDNLFKIMAEKRINQKELAVAISASTGNVSDWKKGRSIPSAQKLDEMATFLDCSVDYLLGRTDKPTTEAGNIIKTGDINGDNNNANGNHIHIGTVSGAVDEQQQEITSMLAELSPRERNKLMSMIYDYFDECKKGD